MRRKLLPQYQNRSKGSQVGIIHQRRSRINYLRPFIGNTISIDLSSFSSIKCKSNTHWRVFQKWKTRSICLRTNSEVISGSSVKSKNNLSKNNKNQADRFSKCKHMRRESTLWLRQRDKCTRTKRYRRKRLRDWRQITKNWWRISQGWTISETNWQSRNGC